MRPAALLAAALLAAAVGAPVALFGQTGTATQFGGASSKWQAPVPDIDAAPCTALRIYQIRLDTGDGGIYYCDGADWQAIAGGAGASALDDLTDVDTAGADALDALIYDGAGGWSPGIPSIEGATGTAASGQPIAINGQTYPSIISTDCEVVGDPGDPASLFCHDGQGYVVVSDEGSILTERTNLNFIGPSITCVDNGDMGSTDCTLTDADDQTAAEVPFTPAGGVAATDAQAAIEEVDAEHTVDTGPAPDCSGTSTYQDGEGGCDAVGGDLTGGLDALALAADAVGLAELAACPGPGEIVEYGASGVPSCIATPSGGGTPGGSDTQAQYNDGGVFGGMTGVTWDDSAQELTIRGRTDAASERVATLSGPDRATPAVGDTAYTSLFSDTSAGLAEVARLSWTTNAGTGASGSSYVDVSVNLAGVLTPALRVTSYGLSLPAVELPAGSASAPGWNFGRASALGQDEGCYFVSNGIVACVGQGGEAFRWQSGIVTLPTAGILRWSTDTGLDRGAAGRVDVTDGSTGAGSILAATSQLVPQASAPTCPAAAAGLYFDSSGSGALCACPPGGAWTIVVDFGSGNCT